MVFALIAFLGGIVLVIAESIFAGSVEIGGIRPDFAVLVVAVATCRTSFGRAMIVAFALGLTRDFYTGGVIGMNAFSLTLMAYLLISAEDYLMTNNWRGQFVVVLVGSLIYGTVFLFLKLIIGYEVASPVQILVKMAWTAIYTSALGPILFMLTKKPASLPYLRLKMKYDAERATLPQTKV